MSKRLREDEDNEIVVTKNGFENPHNIYQYRDALTTILNAPRFKEVIDEPQLHTYLENLNNNVPMIFVTGDQSSGKTTFIKNLFDIDELDETISNTFGTRFVTLISGHPNNTNNFEITANGLPYQSCNTFDEILTYYNLNFKNLKNVMVKYNLKCKRIIQIFDTPGFNNGVPHPKFNPHNLTDEYFTSVIQFINGYKNAHVFNLCSSNQEFSTSISSRYMHNITNNITNVYTKFDLITEEKYSEIVADRNLSSPLIFCVSNSDTDYYEKYKNETNNVSFGIDAVRNWIMKAISFDENNDTQQTKQILNGLCMHVNEKIQSYCVPHINTQIVGFKEQMKNNFDTGVSSTLSLKDFSIDKSDVENAIKFITETRLVDESYKGIFTDNGKILLRMFGECVSHIRQECSNKCTKILYNKYAKTLEKIFLLKDTMYVYRNNDEIIKLLLVDIKQEIKKCINSVPDIMNVIRDTKFDGKIHGCSPCLIAPKASNTTIKDDMQRHNITIIRSFWINNINNIYDALATHMQQLSNTIPNIVNKHIDNVIFSDFIIEPRIVLEQEIFKEIYETVKNTLETK